MEEKGKVLVANLVRKYGEANRELINQCIYKQVRKNSKVIANLTFPEMDRLVAMRMANPNTASTVRSSASPSSRVGYKPFLK
jgi:hypothetical protein